MLNPVAGGLDSVGSHLPADAQPAPSQQYANVDWANRLAQKIGKRTLLATFDKTVNANGVTLNKNAE